MGEELATRLAAPAGAVFLSYASEDVAAADRIATALRAAGIEVWFDRSELRGGEAWDRKIRNEIHDCRLFMPIVSAHTEARIEGYFRREWKLAVDRTHDLSERVAFLVPVVIDSTPESMADVPEAFRAVQWIRLPGGEPSATFVARVSALLTKEGVAARDPQSEVRPSATRASAARKSTAPWIGIVSAAFVITLAGGYIAWRDKHQTEVNGLSKAPAPSTPVADAIPEKSVAVLPFVDMSERHDQEYFSDGLADELIDALTKVPQLRVPARTSSFSFKGKAVTVGEIARTLGVSHVLEGSVRKSGDHVRITAQLVRADSGFHLWSQTYDRNVRDVFAVQDDIAKAVTDELKLALVGTGRTAARQTANIEAYNLYLQAQYRVARDTVPDLEQAVQLYEEALKLDPNYAAAWAGLAACHTRRVANGLDTTGAGYRKATAAATRAIELAPQLVDGYVTLASAKMQYELDWKGLAAALDKVAVLDPNNPLAEEMRGHLAVATGRMSDALAHFRRAVDLDPLNLIARKYLGRGLHYARRTAEAETLLRSAIVENERFSGLHYELGRTLLLKGDAKGALGAFQAETDTFWSMFGLPLGYFANRRLPEAQAALQAQLAHPEGSEFQVAETYGFFGNTEKAFEWLDRAVTQHDPGIIWLRRDALLSSLESDPRYPALLRRVGEPPVSKDD